MSHDDEETQFWSIDDDPEVPASPSSARVRPLPRDEEPTQVRHARAPTAPQRRDSARNWLEPGPEALAPPVRAARAGRRRRRRPVWPRILAPFAFLAAVVAVFSLTLGSGVLDRADGGKPGPTKPPATNSAKPRPKTYTIKAGDTLSQIAARFDTTPEELLRLNPTMSSTTVNPGEKISLPQE